MKMANEVMNDRLLVSILRDICARNGIEFISRSDDWLLELKKGGRTRRVIGYRFDLNNAVASQIAQDKVATHVVLDAKKVPSVLHKVVRSKLSDADRKMADSWGKIVAKPLTGSGGNDIRLFYDTDELTRFISQAHTRAWAIAPWVPIDSETRVILLDGKVLLAYAKQPIEMNNMKMFNLSLGGGVTDVVLAHEQIVIARRAQAAVGLRLCAVDIVSGDQLDTQVLEVNDAFGMEHYARVSNEHKARATAVYEEILGPLF